MQTVVVLGAAGRVGDAVARAFVKRGWRVQGGARNERTAQLAPGVEAVRVDASDREALIVACAGADVIVNALNPQYTEWNDKVMPMARNVMAAAKAAGATHMLPGNVYNFGYDLGMNMAEDASEVASTEKAQIRMDMEALFHTYATNHGVQTLVLRAGDFYGGTKPGSWLDLMILLKLEKDIFTWPGPIDLPHAFAYLPDLGEAFAALAQKRKELGMFEKFHFAGHTWSGSAMKAATEQAVGRKLRLKGVPWPLLRAAGLFMPMMRELVKMSYLWRVAHSLDGARLERVAGPLPTTSPVEAIRQAIVDMKLDGDIKGDIKIAA